MNEIENLVRHQINWQKLREQKLWLLGQSAAEADGLVGLLDALQDAVVKDGIAPEAEVFETTDDNESVANESSPRVSLDGGTTYQDAPQGIRVIYEVEEVPGEDGEGEVHLNLTPEGIITDVWVSRESSLDHNIGTQSETVDELVTRLVEDNT
jgi:hypothetical protein